jgi:K+-transporting ATPase A subunit
MGAEAHTEQSNSRENRLQWFGLLLAPAAWLVQFELNYALVQWVGLKQQYWPLYLVSFIFFLIAIGAFVLSWRNHQVASEGGAGDDQANMRARFLSTIGMMMSALFALLIIVQAIPNFLLKAEHHG